MTRVITAYKCSVCGLVCTEIDLMTEHEAACFAKQKGRQELKLTQLKEARKLARNSEPLKLLARHGYLKAARVLCKDMARWEWLEGGNEEIYSIMIEEVI